MSKHQIKMSGQLRKRWCCFSQLKRTATEKLMNSGDAFSNYVNAELKVDETFITDNRTPRRKKRYYAEAVRYKITLTWANTTDWSKIYREWLAVKKVITLTRERALPIYAQTQQMFLIVQISRLVKITPMSFFGKMRNYFLLCRIYNRIRHLRQTVVASVLVGISAQLSSKVLTDTKINILEKGLVFSPIQNKINEPDLRKFFEELCRRMNIKRYFRNDISEILSEKSAFPPKSKWKQPKGHRSLEVFSSQMEKKFFDLVESPLNYSNLSKE